MIDARGRWSESLRIWMCEVLSLIIGKTRSCRSMIILRMFAMKRNDWWKKLSMRVESFRFRLPKNDKNSLKKLLDFINITSFHFTYFQDPNPSEWCKSNSKNKSNKINYLLLIYLLRFNNCKYSISLLSFEWLYVCLCMVMCLLTSSFNFFIFGKLRECHWIKQTKGILS